MVDSAEDGGEVFGGKRGGVGDEPGGVGEEAENGFEAIGADDRFVVSSVGPVRATEARAVDEKGRPQGISVCLVRPGR